jgi:hypothetical protein
MIDRHGLCSAEQQAAVLIGDHATSQFDKDVLCQVFCRFPAADDAANQSDDLAMLS